MCLSSPLPIFSRLFNSFDTHLQNAQSAQTTIETFSASIQQSLQERADNLERELADSELKIGQESSSLQKVIEDLRLELLVRPVPLYFLFTSPLLSSFHPKQTAQSTKVTIESRAVSIQQSLEERIESLERELVESEKKVGQESSSLQQVIDGLKSELSVSSYACIPPVFIQLI